MDSTVIITFFNINDLDFTKFRHAKGKDISSLSKKDILDIIAAEYDDMPGKATITTNDDIVKVELYPEQLDYEDDIKLKRAISILSENELKLGLEMLEELLEKYPESLQILYNLGMCYTELGEAQKSIKPLYKVIEINPFYSNAYVALSYSFSLLDEMDKAINFCYEAIKYNNENFYAYKNLSGLLGKLGKYDEAIDISNKALLLKPEDPNALYLLGFSYMAKGVLEKADEIFRRIVDNGIDDGMISLAKKYLHEIASKNSQDKGLRMDAVMYMTSAIETFSNMDFKQIQDISFQIGLMGRNGFDINNPDKTYHLDILDKECTGIQLVSMMYVGFQILDPTLNVGLDLSKEYQLAKSMK